MSLEFVRITTGQYATATIAGIGYVATRRDPRLWELSAVNGARITRTQHSSLRQAIAHANTLHTRNDGWICTYVNGPDSTWEFHGPNFYASASSWQAEHNGPVQFGYSIYRVQPGTSNADWVAPNYLGGMNTSSLDEAKTLAARGPRS